MVRPGHRTHDPLPARAILPRDPARRTAQPEGTRGRYERGLVSKRRPTFSDTLAAVRRHFWQEQGFLPCLAIQATRRNSAQRSRKALPMRSATLPDSQSRDKWRNPVCGTIEDGSIGAVADRAPHRGHADRVLLRLRGLVDFDVIYYVVLPLRRVRVRLVAALI